MTDIPATLIIYGRWWYDFVTIAWIAGFFLIEALLLFRNSIIGWAMTFKCLTLAGVFAWAMLHPGPLLPEDVTIDAIVIRIVLIGVLGFVIAVLITMRLMRLTVVVGTQGAQ